jgi:hypothetical protein
MADMTRRRSRASLASLALPGVVVIAIAACFFIFWRHSRVTNIPIADRRLHEMYSLEDGEVLRLVPPPGVPERATFLGGSNPALLPRATFAVRWDGKIAKRWSMSSTPETTVGGVLWEIGIERAHYQMEPGLTLPSFRGDRVADFPAPMEQKLRAVEVLARSNLGRAIVIEKRSVEREVIVARGSFSHKPLSGAQRNPSHVHFYPDKTFEEGMWSGGGSGSLSELLKRVSSAADRQVIDLTTSTPQGRIAWSHYISPEKPDRDEKALEQLLKNLSDQTSLQFTREKRPIEIYFVREAK